MSSPSHSHKAFPVAPTPATSDRVQRDFGLRTQTAARDAFVPAPTQYTNGDEQRYADKCGTYSKGIKQSSVGLVDLAAFQSFRQALDSGDPTDFEEMIVGGTKTQNGPPAAWLLRSRVWKTANFSLHPRLRLPVNNMPPRNSWNSIGLPFCATLLSPITQLTR